jgi:vancomycin resistance protein YoaR
MPDKYYQEYGPIKRRRAAGTLEPEHEPPEEELERELSEQSRLPHPARRRRFPLGTLVFLVVVGALALALPYASNLLASGRALDGVSLLGQPIGGKSAAEIRQLLEQRYADFVRTPLTIRFENHTWTPTTEQLGVRLDLDQAAADALAAGHRGGPFERATELWALWRGGLDVAPRARIDTAVLQSYLASLAPQVEYAPRNASLSIAEGKALPTPAQPGRQLLVDSTMVDIVQALSTLQPGEVVLRTRILTPTIADDGLAGALADARALLGAPLTLRHAERNWTWQPENIAAFLTIQPSGDRLAISIDRERLGRAVEKLAQIADSSNVEPKVAFRDGQLRIVKEGQIGWRIKQPEAIDAISATLRLPQRAVELPGEEITPQVTAKTLPTLGVVELLGEGKSSFAGSAAYRITNIKAGAERMNGVLIAPGQEFSFNTQLGDVDEKNGFVQGYAVIGNSTQLEWGGGVCQDSTTVFRAAFWAGLPITERHAHPFYISWYDVYSFPDAAAPGMDATIYTGVLDLKFLNDTGHWLLMEATTDDDAQVMRVRIYGTQPNRSIEIKGPDIGNRVPPPEDPVYMNDASLPSGTVKQTDSARAGMDIEVYRVITENGQQKPPELFFTRFKAWPDVFVRGTGR